MKKEITNIYQEIVNTAEYSSCVFEENTPKYRYLKYTHRWIRGIRPIIVKYANPIVRLYSGPHGNIDCPIFV